MKFNLYLASFLVTLTSCGGQQSLNDSQQADITALAGKEGSVGSSHGDGGAIVYIPISVVYSDFGHAGTDADAYSFTLADDAAGLSTCKSALGTTADESHGDAITIYKGDRNCLAKLTSLTIGSRTYSSTNAEAVNFTTWRANDSAIFASGGGSRIAVNVLSQLGGPISGTEIVVYSFSELPDGLGE
jgi:hypothetical protein